MRRNKIAIGLLVTFIMSLGTIFSGCNVTSKAPQNASVSPAPANAGGTNNPNAKKLRLAWSVALQEDHPYTVAAQTFKKVVEEQTKGAFQVDLFPGGQLGGDADVFQAIQMGNIDVSVLSAPVIANTSKVLVGADMPYIFDNDYDLLYKAETGDVAKQLLQKLDQAASVKSLAFVYQPFRHFFTNKEIKSIADLKGMKMRTMQSPVHIDIFKALGTTPTPIAYGDVYTAMQAGSIDGFESDVVGAYTSKFYEVAKYVTVSGHFNNAIVLMMSQKAWKGLTPDQQKAVQTASEEAAKASLQTTKASNDKYMQLMKDKGIKINTIDMKPFKEAVKPIIDKYSKDIPEVKAFVDSVESLKKK